MGPTEGRTQGLWPDDGILPQLLRQVCFESLRNLKLSVTATHSFTKK